MSILVFTGPESSGKSWLANELKKHYGAMVVGEYVRFFIDQEQRDTCYEDVETIARGQLAWEDAARSAAPQMLILDTHLLSNMLWSQTLFGTAPNWIESALLSRRYDLHLLLDPVGVEWVDDGQRCQANLDERIVFHQACRRWLETHNQVFIEVGGDWDQRRERVFELVQRWIM
jgi:NadR type nicotinamide-nucleotide adenylyltransferase